MSRFGVTQEDGTLYLTHNALIGLDSDLADDLQLVDRLSGALLHALNLFIDAATDVAVGHASAAAALQATTVGQAFS